MEIEENLVEPIAIIGMACRFPGAKSLEQFWQLLRDGGDAISEVPPERWHVDAFYDPEPATPGKMSTRWGGFLSEVDQFEPGFFGISPREAERMDPQQRLVLEVAWEALEHAGVAANKLAGSRSGVFIGISNADYYRYLYNNLQNLNAYNGTGTSFSITANRLSYILNLRGPSVAIDTACSSSLVAVYLACQSLRNGESNLCLAGGVNLILSPEQTITFSQARMMAADGRCKTFDASADGYVRGEGCGIVLLKRLSDAQRDGDQILALIRGSAVNQDGLSNGLTAPNGPSQQAVIRQALQNAGVAPAQISYVEAHGTGTSLGDPIEVKSLKAVLMEGRSASEPCLLGSVKSNIGHLESAAGIAGLIKVVLSLQHEQIPANLHLVKLNPIIARLLKDTPFSIPTERQPWTLPFARGRVGEGARGRGYASFGNDNDNGNGNGRLSVSPFIRLSVSPPLLKPPRPPQNWGGRLAGLSSFGFGGTNAHLILSQAPPQEKVPNPAQVERPKHLLTLSAKSEEALQALAQRYVAYLDADTKDELSLADLAFTTNTGRQHFKHRLAVVAESTAELRAQLASHLSGQASAGVLKGQVQKRKRPKIAFLFTGQGSQYVEMGRQLYETQPTFRQVIDRCDEILSGNRDAIAEGNRDAIAEGNRDAIAEGNRDAIAEGNREGLPLLSVLYPEEGMSSPLDETVYTQPALFALEYALAELWQSWGITPDLVMGHSVGEIVAACVAGVFSLEDGLKLIAERARLMEESERGEMVAAFAAYEVCLAAIQPDSGQVSLAAINGPENTVISGQPQAVNRVVERLHQQGVKTTRLKVSHAFHSPLMEPILDSFERVAREVRYSTPKIKIISNLTGQLVSQEITTAEYWVRHIRQPVRFADGVRTLQQQKMQLFLEIGPKPTLLAMARRCAEGLNGEDNGEDKSSSVTWLPSLRQGRDEWQQMLHSLAQLYVLGVPVEWVGFEQDYATQRRRLTGLPTYPWQRQRHWLAIEAPATVWKKKYSNYRVRTENLHPLLGQRLHVAHPIGQKAYYFESQLSSNSPAYLAEHRVYGQAILPATAYLEMAWAAGYRVAKSESLLIEEVAIEQALTFDDQDEDDAKSVQVILTPVEKDSFSFQIFTLTEFDEQESSWTRHAEGQIRVQNDLLAPLRREGLANWPAQRAELVGIKEEMNVKAYYQELYERGLEYGPAFQAIEQLWRQEGESLAKIRLPDALRLDAEPYKLHPVLLDACLQMVGAALFDDQQQETYLPVGIKRLTFFASPPLAGAHLWSHAEIRKAEGSNQALQLADLRLFDARGTLVAHLEGLSLRRATRSALLGDKVTDDLYEIEWQRAPRPKVDALSGDTDLSGRWLIFADEQGIGAGVASLLNSTFNSTLNLKLKQNHRAQRCVLISAGQTYQSERQRYQINPSEPQHWRRLLAEMRGQTIRGVVHLWGLDEGSTLEDAQRLGCGSALHLVQALAQSALSVPLWLVTRGTQSVSSSPTVGSPWQASLWGLGKVIALEHPEFSCVRIDLAPSERQNARQDEEVQLLFNEITAPDREEQVAYRQGVRYVPRLVRFRAGGKAEQAQSFKVMLSRYGTLDNLHLADCDFSPPEAGEVEIEVYATGLNFRDVLVALGLLKEYYAEHLGIESATDIPFGFECAGIIKRIGKEGSAFKVGDEVIALASGSLASSVTVKAQFVVPKPKDISFEGAATLPLAFLTAYYGLHHLAQIQPGERVLIHAAAGGVGQAAVQLAQRVGAEIFATASTGKWEFLQQAGIDANHLMNSRTLEFADQVMQRTGGQGVDIVLNSLSGRGANDGEANDTLPSEFIEKGVEVLAKGGRFVELGKIGIWSVKKMQEVRPDIAYFPFDLGEIAQKEPDLISAMLAELMDAFRQGTHQGALKPLPLKVFPMQKVSDAFRYMAQTKHIGKVVVSLPKKAAAWPIRDHGSYLITGGLGALGRGAAGWLVEQGAQQLVLIGRRGADGHAQEAVSEFRRAGCQVLIVKGDVSNPQDVASVLAACPQPLRGIIHAAGILDDGMLRTLSWPRFEKVMAPKIQGAWNLHSATREQPLDFFVCFSSIASLLGSPGQANYSAANAFMDALAHHRRALGLPALSINWGPWAAPSEGSVSFASPRSRGMAATLSRLDQHRMAEQGLEPIAPKQGWQIFGHLLKLKHASSAAQVGVLKMDWSTFLRTTSLDSPFLEAVKPARQVEKKEPSLLQQLEKIPPNERRALLERQLRAVIGKTLAMEPEQITPRQRLFDLGLDSLMAVELRNRLKSELGRSFSSTLLFNYPTLEALVDYLAQEVLPTLLPEAPSVPAAKPVDDPLAPTEKKSLLDEMAEQLAKKLAALN